MRHRPAPTPRRPTYYHGGKPGLRVGDKIWPRTKTGYVSTFEGYDRADRVYLATIRPLAEMFAFVFTPGPGWLYEVKPVGPVEIDPGHPGAFMAPRAIVTRIVTRGVTGIDGASKASTEAGLLKAAATEFGVQSPIREPVCEPLGVPKVELTASMAATAGVALDGIPDLRELFRTYIEVAPRVSRSAVHGLYHVVRVASYGLQLASEATDLPAVLAFALLHDALRESDGADDQHGERAARLALDLNTEGILAMNAARLDTLRAALAGHEYGATTTDPTAGVCWDSDRLDLRRLGIAPDPALLSTTRGRALPDLVSRTWQEVVSAYLTQTPTQIGPDDICPRPPTTYTYDSIRIN